MIEAENQIEEAPEQAAGLNIGDIYYVLFRHKWKVIGCFIAALIGAAVVYTATPRLFKSEAKLLIRYVLEGKTVTVSAGPNDSQILRPETRGDTIINTEIEILNSLDLARQVAAIVGPEKLLGKGGSNDIDKAAAMIAQTLDVQAPGKGNVINIGFQHPNREIVQPVLQQLIDLYKKKHRELHDAGGILDPFLLQQAEHFRSELLAVEQELSKTKNDAGILSIEEAKRSQGGEQSRIRKELSTAQVELAEHKTLVEQARKSIVTSDAAASEYGAPLDKLKEYQGVVTRLEMLLDQEREYATKFTEEHPRVKGAREQITIAEERKKKLEQENPKLANVVVPSGGTNAIHLGTELSRVSALEAKIRLYGSQLERLAMEITNLNKAELIIAQLERKREAAEANYKRYEASLEQAHLAEALGAGKIRNINEVQQPSPAARVSSKMKKTIGIILALGVFGGIGLAFLIELVLDQSLKRPGDIRSKLTIPLFLSIPSTLRNGRFALRNFRQNGRAQIPRRSESTETASDPTDAEVPTWEPTHALRPYYEALRDRLLTYFEVKNMTRKPKLVAVTSCGTGSGVTTIASGLAASLSETGDGNVLLVDLNDEQAAAHPFYKGKPRCGLPDVFENGKRDAALVQENLYMVSASGGTDRWLRRGPKRFTDLFPKFKASDYDYIIFDMPPVNSTSITPRIASFMDMVLFVVESEKTHRGIARQATELLSSHANVSAILNKTQTYVPEWAAGAS